MINQLMDYILYGLYYWPCTLLVCIILVVLFFIVNAYKNKRTKQMLFFSTLIPLSILSVWLFIGYVMSPTPYDDAEYAPQFFIKKHPTFKLKFRDFYLDAGDVAPFSRMLATDKKQLADYCNYRYGLTIHYDQELIACIKTIHPDVDLENPNG